MILRRGLTLLFWRTRQILLGIIHLFCEFYFGAPPTRCAHVFLLLQPWTLDVFCSELNGLSKELNIKLVTQEQLNESKETAERLSCWDFCIIVCFSESNWSMWRFPCRLLTWTGVCAFWPCEKASQRTANICTSNQRWSGWISYYWSKNCNVITH